MQFQIFFNYCNDKQKEELMNMLRQYSNAFEVYEYDFEISASVNDLGVEDSSYSGYIDIKDFNNGLPSYEWLTPEQGEIYLTMYYPASAWVKGIFHGFEYECKVYTLDRNV